MRVVWTESAKSIRNDLINFIALDNVLAALEVDDTITAATLRLGNFPRMGKQGRIRGTRELVVHEHYVLVYEVVDDSLVILMILHTSRQWPPDNAEVR